MKNETVQVGDIYVNTWGYDQTNVDAYQVVRTTPKMMVLLEIDTSPVPGTDGFMCCRVVPVKDSFKRTVKSFKVRTGGRPIDGFKLNYGWASKWDGVKTYYNSWYA